MNNPNANRTGFNGKCMFCPKIHKFVCWGCSLLDNTPIYLCKGHCFKSWHLRKDYHVKWPTWVKTFQAGKNHPLDPYVKELNNAKKPI